jgi:hypothetical protein
LRSALWVLLWQSALADVHYVDLNSTNATPPYTNWGTAATNIQVAVYAAVAGDEIVVTNGTYAGGVSINKPLTVRTVNGPQFTTIAGGGPCVSLASNSSLSGFTVTGGHAISGGGVYCQSSNAVVSNCVITGNQAYADNPRVTNVAFGGGAYGGTLNNCTLADNSASYYDYDDFGGETAGGGAAYCTLNHCTLSGNSASIINLYNYDGTDFAYGGGAAYCTLNNCALSSNSVAASGYSIATGGGAASCTLNNCTLTGNSGYGALSCLLTNCTLTGNTYGAFDCALANCITYFNSGGNYDSSSTLSYCCTTPLPTNGVGNISSDPELASASHLSIFSPCIGRGNYATVSGTDIDGEPWANPPSIGCDEYHAGAVTGPLSAAISVSFTNVAVGYAVALTARIGGRTDLSVWDFGDGALEINQPYTTHSWAMPGDYLVSLWCFSDSYPGGVSATVTVHVVTGFHYVAFGSTNPTLPYTSWATAATNIQDAIAVAEAGAQVFVANGTYAPMTAFNPLSVRSVSGPAFTIIDGGRSNQCASLGNETSLTGFTLKNGYGGGASGGTLSNCVLSGNLGGGALNCRLNNCALTGNTAYGAWASALNNCTLTGNDSGAFDSFLTNCIAYFNTSGNYSSCTLNHCCTTPCQPAVLAIFPPTRNWPAPRT